LMIRMEQRSSSAKVIEALADVMILKGVSEHLRSDNGAEAILLVQKIGQTSESCNSIPPQNCVTTWCCRASGHI
jgi:hypothetical protein